MPAPSPPPEAIRRQFRARYGPWAVIAGAAEGLGAAMAEAIAQRGLHVWLIDHNAQALSQTASKIAAAHKVEVHSQVVDLALIDAVRRIEAARDGRDVGLIAYVAAFAPVGPFADGSCDDHLRAITVNCGTPVALVHSLLPNMIRKGRGGVLLFSSMAGFQGSGHIANYAATKAFDLVFSEGLGAELGPRGIDVAAVCPGPTLTPGYLRSRPSAHPAPVMQPEQVVAEALDRLGRRAVIIPGRINRWSRWFLNWLGRARAVALVSRATARMYPSRMYPQSQERTAQQLPNGPSADTDQTDEPPRDATP